MISALNHENLVNFKEFKNDATYMRKRAGKDGKTEYKCIAIILEYAEAGELFDYVARSGFFAEDVARTYFSQMLDGLEYLNSKGLCHSDIKPENLLFDDEFNLKLCDFGFSYCLSGRDGSG
jgi:serine/threonine protein kinase